MTAQISGRDVRITRLGALSLAEYPDMLRHGTDAVLLAAFANAVIGDRRGVRCSELGAGSGVISLLLCDAGGISRMWSFELVPELAELCVYNAGQNGLADTIRACRADIRDTAALRGYISGDDPTAFGHLDLVVANPPYKRPSSGGSSLSALTAAAKTASHGGIAEFAASARAMLRHGGSFCAVWPAQGLAELLEALRTARLEPKLMCMVCSDEAHPPQLTLMRAVSGGKPGLAHLPPLFLKDANGCETPRMRKIYDTGVFE